MIRLFFYFPYNLLVMGVRDFYNPSITVLHGRGIVYLSPRLSTAILNGCNFRNRVLEY
jgi:hypothetical protein